MKTYHTFTVTELRKMLEEVEEAGLGGELVEYQDVDGYTHPVNFGVMSDDGARSFRLQYWGA